MAIDALRKLVTVQGDGLQAKGARAFGVQFQLHAAQFRAFFLGGFASEIGEGGLEFVVFHGQLDCALAAA